MNIDYTIDNYRFTTRCSAIIYNKEKNKILLCKGEDRDYYMLPGGRTQMFENSKNCIKREIKEELGYEINFSLLSIEENYVIRNDIKITQYCFCFEGIYEGIVEQDEFKCLDNDWQIFKWVNINEIDKYNIVPKNSIDLIKNKNNGIIHLIEYGNE